MFVAVLLSLIAAVVAIHLFLTIRVILPLARPHVDIGASLQSMSDVLQDTIQEETKLSADRIRKQIERSPKETDGQLPTPHRVRAGEPVAR